jgi:RNA polymerase sigma factor (sigma-70 family)
MTPMPFTAPLARALLRSQSDERLVRLARDRHEGAFEEIVRRYRAPLVAFAAAYAPSERAEDVVQESLTNAWAALAGSNREIALKPWLYTIVRNRALNARRDTRYHSELDEAVDSVARPEQIVLERDELTRAVAAIALLPDAQRKALVDSAIEGRTHDQIAAEMEVSAGSVRGLIHRGRVAVRGAVGALVPFPIVAWAAGSGGAVAGGVAAGSAVGGSVAAKGAAVAAVAVLATGSGIVFERSLNDRDSQRQASASEVGGPKEPADSGDPVRGGGEGPARGQGSAGSGPGSGGGSGQGDGDDGSGPGGNEDNSGRGEGNEDNSGHGGGDDDSSGHGSGDDSAEDNSGPGGGDDDSSGPGSGSDDGHSSSGSSGSGSSGSGSSGSGSSGSGSSGSGSSGSGSIDEDSSGSGSSNGGSGSDDFVVEEEESDY